MIRLFPPVLTGLAALGCEAALISYTDAPILLFALLSFALTSLFCLFSSFLSPSKQWRGALFFPLLVIVLILFNQKETMTSGTALYLSMAEKLSEPYNLLLSLPRPEGSPVWMLLLVTLINTAFFTAGFHFRLARAASFLYYAFIVFIGFYFNLPPPAGSAVLLAVWGLSLAAKEEKTGLPSRLITIAAFFIGGLIFLAVPPQSYSQPAFLADIQSKIISFTDPYDPIFHAGHALSSMERGADGSQYLGQTSGVQFTGRYLASIRSPAIQKRLYLRAWTGGVYEKNQWKNLPSQEYRDIELLFRENQGEWYDQGAWFMEYMAHDEALADTLNSYLDHPVDISSRRSKFSVTAVYDKTKFYYLPYDADFGAPFFVLDRSPEGSGDKTYLTERWDIPEGAVVSMVQGPLLNDSYYNTYTGAEKIYRDFVYSHYCAVPDGVLGQLGEEISIPKAATMAEKRAWTASVQNFLINHFTYTTQPGPTPQGKDFISYFLNVNHKGYCTAFASAGVMLLRAAGIPARYVVGLTVGPDELNSQDADADGMHSFDINDYHAHAWAEVYVDGLGWRPCEFTPGKEGSVNPFPVEETQKRDHKTPDREEEQNHQIENELSKKSATPAEPKQHNANSKKQPSSPSPMPAKEHPAQDPQSRIKSPRLGIAFIIVLFILCLSGLIIWHRLRAVPLLLNRLISNEKKMAAGMSYLLRLTAWAGFPLNQAASNSLLSKSITDQAFSFLRMKVPLPSAYPKDYGDWVQKVSKDSRFASFAQLISLLEKSRFSGQPLSKKEESYAAGLIRDMRQNCINRLSFREKISFLLGWKL